MAKARALSRQSVAGVESQLARMTSETHEQIDELQHKLQREVQKRCALETELKDYKNVENKLRTELDVSEGTVRTLREECAVWETRFATVTVQLHEAQRDLSTAKRAMDAVADELRDERGAMARLRVELGEMRAACNVVKGERETLCVEGERIRGECEALRRQLCDVQASDEMNRSRVCDLEELVARLEQGVARLEAADGQEDVMARLQGQVTALQEALAAEKQTARAAKTALWRKEKELSDCDLDRRIGQRELKAAEEKVATLTVQLGELTQQLVGAREELETVQGELRDVQALVAVERGQRIGDEERVARAENAVKRLEDVCTGLRDQKRDVERQLAVVQTHLERTGDEKRVLGVALQEAEVAITRLEAGVEQRDRDMEKLRMNHAVLRDACVLLESQVEDFERILDAQEKKKQVLMGEKDTAEESLERARRECQTAKQAVNEEKSLRLLAENRAQRLEEELREMGEDKENLSQQVLSYKRACERLNEQLAEAEEQLADQEVKVGALQRSLATVHAEEAALKEEMSRHLTTILTLKQSNVKATQELDDRAGEISVLRQQLTALENRLQEQLTHYQHRDIKSQATQEQQAKLISYLQSQLEEHHRKKKTLTDKLFGSSKKENVPPNWTPNRTLETKLQEERARNQQLVDQLQLMKVQEPVAPVGRPVATIEGAVKVAVGGKWERRYVRLETGVLRVYDSVESATATFAMDVTGARLATEVTREECAAMTADRDLPFILRLETGPATTCWPAPTIQLLMPSTNAKLAWTGALQPLVAQRPTLGHIVWRCPVGTFPECVVPLPDGLILVGCEQGVYSVGENKPAVLLGGVTHVHHLAVSASLGLVVMIAGAQCHLLKAPLRGVESAARAASACSNPSVTTQLVSDEQFHLLALSARELLCAATRTHIAIFKYNSHAQNYVPARTLDTAQPCTALLFREHSLLVAANKVFEVDLRDYTADEFLDASDTSLSHAVHGHQVGAHPIALVAISSGGETEFLLAYPEFGVFVDEFGRRTRPEELRWPRAPRHVAYRRPYLFVVHQEAVEVRRLQEGVAPVRLAATDVRVLGDGAGAIYVLHEEAVRFVSGRQVVAEDDDDASSADEDEANATEFSFTSSIVESLERARVHSECDSSSSDERKPSGHTTAL